MDSLREFFASSSGLIPARRGLGLGWLISALTGVAFLIGGKEAGACCMPGILWENCDYNASCPEEKPKLCVGERIRADCVIESFSYCTT